MKLIIFAAFFSGYNFVAAFLPSTSSWLSFANAACAIYCMYVAVSRAIYIHQREETT